MDWGLAEEDFRFMMDLEPSGCFVAMEDGKAVGLVTTINFGQVGWIGNVIIEKDRRNRGIGSLLVEHAMNYLKQRKTETIGLYAYLRAVPLYSRLGFRTDTNFVVLEGQSVSKPARRNVREAEEKDLAGILNLDSYCFGGVRKRLIERIFSNKMNLCYVGCRGDELLGMRF
jgi:ribosomal protein S18 acetylase RimI-like enzyme